MNHGSLFSGIGGFDLAAEWMGWNNMFHCEIDRFCQRVLKYYWSNAESYGDIKKTDFTIYRGRIDVLTGGFPCQPFSLAGKRKGTDDDRHLWPEMLRAIKEIHPVWIVGENVYGIVNWDGGLVFNQVQSDLESEGYEVQPVIIPACSVNAPHRRDRVWFIAYSQYSGNSNKSNKIQGESQRKGMEYKHQIHKPEQSDDLRTSPDTINTRTDNGLRVNQNRKEKNEGWERQSQSEFRKNSGTSPNTNKRSKQKYGLQTGEEMSERAIITDTNMAGRSKECEPTSKSDKSGRFNSEKDIIRKPESWQDFPTQSPLCSRDDGFSSKLHGITFSKWRNESIKAYGNAIVPQVVYEIFKTIQNYDTSNNNNEVTPGC